MKISEFADKTGISKSTLRFYESKGLIIIKRDQNNRRIYDEADISWMQFIQKLKDTGMLLRDIQKYSQLRYQGPSTMQERLGMMEKHKKYVDQQYDMWEKYSKNLDDKITYYKTEIQKNQ